MRWWRWLAGLGAVAALGVAVLALREARADPVVRRATIALPGWPAGARPVRVALLSDVHIGTMAMDAARLERIVREVDALRPDLVLIAGDFIFGHDPFGAARLGPAMVGPLGRLRAPLGTVAVLGNHDHWTGAATVRGQLRAAGVTVLENEATLRGPLAIGGVGDDFTHRADVAETMRRVRQLRGAAVLLTHSPDVAPELPADATLLLAGHTHCGQVAVFGRPIAPEVSRWGGRYRCGLIREGARTVVVTAGLGTSGAPVRLGAPPEVWLLTLGPR